MITLNELERCVIAGLAIGIFLIVFAFVSGSTFGQRCSVEYAKDRKNWHQCVKRLSEGGEV